MPFELFLALRYLRARRGRRVARWTAGAAVVGIACGVAALVVATALANGFRDELQDKILRGTAHVTLSGGGGAWFEASPSVAESVRNVEGVRDAQPTTYEGALLNGPAGSSYILLRGLDARTSRANEAVRATLTAGSLQPLFANDGAPALPVVLGEELAARTGLARVGAEGWVLAVSRRPGAQTLEPHTTRVRVAGLFRSGLYEYDSSWVYVWIPLVESVVGAPPDSLAVSIEAKEMEESAAVARRVREALGPGWTTVYWREANRPLFEALALE